MSHLGGDTVLHICAWPSAIEGEQVMGPWTDRLVSVHVEAGKGLSGVLCSVGRRNDGIELLEMRRRTRHCNYDCHRPLLSLSTNNCRRFVLNTSKRLLQIAVVLT